MTKFQPYTSRNAFLAACRNRSYLGNDEVCIVCRAEFSSSANAGLDPNLLCLGPAIRLPCCPQVVGHACILSYLKHYDPVCLICGKTWYDQTRWEKFRALPAPKQWLETLEYAFVCPVIYTFIIQACLLILGVFTRKLSTIEVMLRLFISLFRFAMELCTCGLMLTFLNIPVQPELAEGFFFNVFIRNVVIKYRDLPKWVSVPITVGCQLHLVYLAWCEVFQGGYMVV